MAPNTSTNATITGILERMERFCLTQSVGVEYLLLLLAIPQSFVSTHRVLPQKLMDCLLGEVMENERAIVFEGTGKELTHTFACALNEFVRARSLIPGLMESMVLREPDASCGIGFLRVFLPSTNVLTVSVSDICAHIGKTLRDLGLVRNGMLQATFVETTSGCAITFNVIATLFTHYMVVCALRKKAFQFLWSEGVVCSEKERALTKGLLMMEGASDGVFEELPGMVCGGRMDVESRYSEIAGLIGVVQYAAVSTDGEITSGGVNQSISGPQNLLCRYETLPLQATCDLHNKRLLPPVLDTLDSP